MEKAEKIFKSVEELRGGATEVLSRVTQLRGVLKHNMMVEAKNKNRSQELQNLSSDLDKRIEIFEKEKAEAGNLKKLVEECSQELRLKRNELTEKERKCEHLAELQRLCSEETDKKKDEWALVLEGIRESEKRLVVLKEELEVKSLELGSREKDLGVVREAIALSSSDLELKKKMVRSLNNEITVCAQKIDSKSGESGEIQKLIEEQTSDLVGLEKKHKEMLESICRSSSKMEKLVKEVKAAETEASGFCVRSERFRKEIEDKQKELDVIKNQIESEEKKLVQVKGEMEEVTGLRKKDLELTLSRIEESGHQLAAVNEQLDLKSKELEEIERELKLKRRLRQMNTVCVKREKETISDSSSQQDAEEETEPMDTFMLHGISASLISSVLRASPNPAEFVLERVQDEIREGSSFQDTFLETLVLIFEELVKIQQLDEVAKTQGPDNMSQLLQLQATEVATLWKEKITIEAPKSTLEVLAFLLFIMAFKLKTLINEEETALLAWSIAHYERAPILFEYLSINLTIREVVEELIKKSEYISAVRLICLFTLDNEVSFSPSELLKKEIINFRGSALENRSTGSSQEKEKDGGRLRAILELVADYKLEIDLPGDLMAKLMVEGERSVRLVSFSVEHDTSSSLTPQAELKKKQLGSSSTTPQAELKKKQLGQVKTVLVKHTGVDDSSWSFRYNFDS